MTKRYRARNFMNDAIQSYTDDCIVWPFSKNPSGYGNINIPGRSLLVHRIVLEETQGLPPDGKPYACHSCHNPSCINPRHLNWQSQQANMDDKLIAGTQTQIGETHSQAKLTEDDVRAIRVDERWPRFVAKDYGVTTGTIIDIRAKRSWKHVA